MSDFSARVRARAARTAAPPRAPANGRLPLVAYVVGARPNFVKMAPVVDAMRRRGHTRQLIVHTGQHYDRRLSGDILDDLGFPDPDVCLEVGSGSHGDQTGKVLAGFEQVLMERRPDLVVVAGDVNSTLACALAAAKLCVPVAHLEAGLRSEDWTMPEEVNRVLTDRMSDVLLTHSPEAEPNLLREGIDPARIHYVGNTMIDSLRRLEGRARRRAAWRELDLNDHEYVLVTLHRPSNVDDPVRLSAIVEALISLGERAPVVFPIHPRTRARLRETHGLRRLTERRRALHRAGRLPRLPLAPGRRGRDRDGLRRRAGGGGRPGRALLHVPRQHGAAGHADPRHQRAARRRPRPDRGRSSPRRCRRRRRRSRSGTATPPTAPPTCSRPLLAARASGEARLALA